MTDYLACTKSPPRDVPRQMGIGLCVAPRNHDGACKFEWMGGYVQVEVDGPDPRELIQAARHYHRTARRARTVIVWCALVNIATSAFLVYRVMFP